MQQAAPAMVGLVINKGRKFMDSHKKNLRFFKRMMVFTNFLLIKTYPPREAFAVGGKGSGTVESSVRWRPTPAGGGGGAGPG